MKNKIFPIAMAAALMADLNSSLDNNSKTSIDDIDFTPKIPPIPKGCKRHYFNEFGECEQARHKVYFDAMKRSTAYEKWKRWMNDRCQ